MANETMVEGMPKKKRNPPPESGHIIIKMYLDHLMKLYDEHPEDHRGQIILIEAYLNAQGILKLFPTLKTIRH